MEKLVQYLIDKNLTISTCESFTGGLFANLITDIPNASKTFKGAFICYSNDFKKDIIKVNDRIIKKYGVVSKQCAIELAKNTQKITKTDVVISFTGNAGPGSLEDKEVGLAYICMCTFEEIIVLKIRQLNLSRVEFKKNAVKEVLMNIYSII
ncbi:competence damage-inducible protein A [Entomoplasma ellychniae]|uniref:Competence damage-inducible protein A n=1 Tax=Entomoplasma ellychniae TaxID=2114 RepID=A0A8E2UED9_9MOLU|nr:CinA family protein [Entomoplasma ellychniae]PPE04998.1 competence damage-inducible protein A [Entomoplasma ellychniae]